MKKIISCLQQGKILVDLSAVNTTKISTISKNEFLKRNAKFDLSTFKFLIEIDENDPSHLIIVKDNDVKLSNEAVKEAIKRVKYLFKIKEHLNTFYKPPYNPKDLIYDENLPQYPYLLYGNPMPKLWGFVQEPQKALYLSGQNFIEHSALGLMTNPQPLYTEYSFGDFYGDDLDKIRIPAFNKLNNLHKIRLNFFEKIISQACQKLNKKPEDLKILDVGCNTGRDLQLLNGENKYKHLYGIDIDKKSLDVLNKLIKKDELNNIKIAEIDFLNPNISTELAQKLGNNKFDVLNFSATLEHLINPELACKHFSEILAPGGVLILTSVPDIESVRGQFEESYGDFQKPTHYYYYSKESLKTMGNKFGLDFVPMTELLPCFSKLDLLYEEVFPAIKNGKWHFFNKPLPENIKFEDVFVKNTPPNLNVFFKDPDFKMLAAGVNFRYFKNYNKNLEAFNLIYKEFFYNSIKNPQKAKEYVKQLKENLFNLFILDKPKDFDYEAIDKLENYSLALLTKKYSEKVGNFYTIDGYWTKK